jgi:hypothetical protein
MQRIDQTLTIISRRSATSSIGAANERDKAVRGLSGVLRGAAMSRHSHDPHAISSSAAKPWRLSCSARSALSRAILSEIYGASLTTSLLLSPLAGRLIGTAPAEAGDQCKAIAALTSAGEVLRPCWAGFYAGGLLPTPMIAQRYFQLAGFCRNRSRIMATTNRRPDNAQIRN